MTEERPFSLVIPHRDRPDQLRATLSRTWQKWGQWIRETIVVDDGSTVPLSHESWNVPNVSVIHNSNALGPAACRNLGADQAQSPFLLFLDDDSWPLSGDLESVAREFCRNDQLAAIGFRVSLGDSCEGGGAFNAFVGCGAAVRRDRFLAAGGFPEVFRFYVEEYALCYRLIEMGYDIRNWSEPVVFHAKVSANRDWGLILGQLVYNNRRILEPHRNDQPGVSERLNELFAWYKLLGKRHGVLEAVEAAESRFFPETAVAKWSLELWEKLSGVDRLNRFAQKLAENNFRSVELWPVGKDTFSFARVLRDHGIVVGGVLDPDSRYGIDEFHGLPVLKARQQGGLVVCSFSPGLCWNAKFGTIHDVLGPCEVAFEFDDLTQLSEIIAK